jgi:hypothetical protein
LISAPTLRWLNNCCWLTFTYTTSPTLRVDTGCSFTSSSVVHRSDTDSTFAIRRVLLFSASGTNKPDSVRSGGCILSTSIKSLIACSFEISDGTSIPATQFNDNLCGWNPARWRRTPGDTRPGPRIEKLFPPTASNKTAASRVTSMAHTGTCARERPFADESFCFCATH